MQVTKALTVLESTVTEKAREVGSGGRAMPTGLVTVNATKNAKTLAEVTTGQIFMRT